MMTHAVRLILADDDALVRYTLRQVLEKTHCEVVAEATNGRDAVEAAEWLKPDIVLLDISMPIMNGFEAARELRRRLPKLLIVFISSHWDATYMEEARSLQINGYLAKARAADDLPRAVQAVMAGGCFFSAAPEKD